MNEVARVYQWLLQTINTPSVVAAGAQGFYPDVAPLNATLPAVVFSLQSSQDSNSASAYRLLTDSIFWVRAVGLADQFITLVAIADAVDALLNRVQGSAGGVNIILCVRQRSLILTQQLDGQLYSYVGGLYDIEANTGQ